MAPGIGDAALQSLSIHQAGAKQQGFAVDLVGGVGRRGVRAAPFGQPGWNEKHIAGAAVHAVVGDAEIGLSIQHTKHGGQCCLHQIVLRPAGQHRPRLVGMTPSAHRHTLPHSWARLGAAMWRQRLLQELFERGPRHKQM